MPTGEPVRGPLDDLLRRAGATMVERDGRLVAAHYGSRAGEVAACRGAAGIADRSERATLELRGDADAVDRVVAAVTHRPASRVEAVRAGYAWWCRVTSGRVMLRCEASHHGECWDALAAGSAVEAGTSVADVGADYAAIEVIGPRARQVLRAAGFDLQPADTPDDAPLIVLREGGDAFELVSDFATARATWERLHAAGRPLGAASVGLDALDMIAAGEHLDVERTAAS